MFNLNVFRLPPKLPVTEVKTYAIKQSFRPATCSEVECPRWRDGWDTIIDQATVLGTNQADYIRARSGRAFTEVMESGTVVRFKFKPGQRCFGSDKHRVPVERPPLYVVRDGDWRGNPRRTPVVNRTEANWVEDFALHQQKLADRFQQG